MSTCLTRRAAGSEQPLARRPDVGGIGEFALHRRKSLRHVLAHAIEQERRRPELLRARLPPRQQRAVEQDGRVSVRGHGGWYAAATLSGNRAACSRASLDGWRPDTAHPALAPLRRASARSAAHGRTRRELALDIALPTLCVACREPVEGEGVCAECWTKLSFIEPPYCPRLGIPFVYDPGPDMLSMEAIANPPAYSGRAPRCAMTRSRARWCMR